MRTILAAALCCWAGLAGAQVTEADVREYGAVPDDAFDDTLALQAAFDSGRPLKCTGTYQVGTGGLFTRLAKFRLRGEGYCKLVGSDASGALVSSMGTTFAGHPVPDAPLEEFILRDIVLTTSNFDLSLAAPGQVPFSLLTIVNSARRVHIENVEFNAALSRQGGILLASSLAGHYLSDIHVVNCRFAGPIGGVTLYAEDQFDGTPRITEAVIQGNSFANNGLMDDILSATPTSMAISIAGKQRRISVLDNIIKDYPYSGIEVASRAAGTSDYTIHGNRMRNTGWGIIFDAGGNNSVRMERMSVVGNVMEGNRRGQRFNFLRSSTVASNVVTVKDDGSGAGYGTRAAARPGTFVQFEFGDGNTVTGNIFDVDLPWGEAAKARVNLSGFADSILSGNRFRTTGNWVLWTHNGAGGVERNVVVGNSFEHSPAGGNLAEATVSMAAGTSKNVFLSNSFRSNNSLTVVQAGATGNLARGSTLFRTDLGRFFDKQELDFAVAGTVLDLTAEAELETVKVVGAPSGAFTVTVPPVDRVLWLHNATSQPADVRSVTGTGMLIAPGTGAWIRVQDAAVAAEGFGPPQASALVVSGDVANQNLTLSPRQMQPVVRYASTLTGNRTVTLLTTGAKAGDWWRLVRSASPPGNFTLNVGPGIKTIPANKSGVVEVGFDPVGQRWVLVDYSEW